MAIKSLAIKSAIGIAGVGGATFVAFQGYQYSKKEQTVNDSVADKLTENKYKLLTDNSNTWATVLEKYKELLKSSQEFKFDSFDGTKPSDSSEKAEDILKHHCKGALSKKKSDTDSNVAFEKAKKWCVEPISISKLLTAQKYDVLKAEGDLQQKDKSKWDEKIKQYRTSNEKTKKFENLNLGNDSAEVEEANYKTIREKCNEVNKIMNHDATFEEDLKGFVLWCVNK